MKLCTICARGGSKGVPGKNVRIVAGRPLIAHSVQQALDSGLFDAIAVSSDSDEILKAAGDAGAQVLIRRPDVLASDTSAKIPAIQHCVKAAEDELGRTASVVVDMDATSPLRSVEDIVAVVEMLKTPGAINVITAAPARRSPYFNMVETGADGVPRLAKRTDPPVVRRQDAPDCYDMNASIYGWHRDALFSGESLFTDGTRLHVMPEDRSHDVDSELDFTIVSMLMETNK